MWKLYLIYDALQLSSIYLKREQIVSFTLSLRNHYVIMVMLSIIATNLMNADLLRWCLYSWELNSNHVIKLHILHPKMQLFHSRKLNVNGFIWLFVQWIYPHEFSNSKNMMFKFMKCHFFKKIYKDEKKITLFISEVVIITVIFAWIFAFPTKHTTKQLSRVKKCQSRDSNQGH